MSVGGISLLLNGSSDYLRRVPAARRGRRMVDHRNAVTTALGGNVRAIPDVKNLGFKRRSRLRVSPVGR